MPRFNLPTRGYGIELETQRGDVRRLGTFGKHHDGSIDGWEFVSPILRGRSGLRTIRQFIERGEGIRVDRQCGYHVHIGMEALDNRKLFKVFMAYLATQDQWFLRVTRSRHSNSYCMRHDNSMFADALSGCRRGVNFMDFCYDQDRYNWLNIAAYEEHGTFENRLHHGTWNWRKVNRWIVLNLHFVRLATRMRVAPNTTYESFRREATYVMGQAIARMDTTIRPPVSQRAVLLESGI